MRWDRLFADLEAQLEAGVAADAAAEVADRVRREHALVRLVDRLRPRRGAPVALLVAGAGPVHGIVREVGPTWLLLEESAGREALVALAAVLSVTGLTRASATPGSEGQVARRLGLSHVLRGLARDRSPVTLTLVDGSQMAGTIDRVGADFVDVAEHGPGEARRAEDVWGVRAVPHSAISVVRRG